MTDTHHKTGPAPRKKRRSSYSNSPAAEALRRKWRKDPEWAAKMRGHIAKNAENRRKGIGNRRGVPDGYTREEAEWLREDARELAKWDIKKMIDNGTLKIETTDDQKAAEALEAAIAVVRSPGEERNKIAAIKIVLDFCKAKPVAKSEVTVKNAEDWLAAVTAASTE